MGRTQLRLVAVAVAILGVALGVGACREDEQDRVLLFQKGVYLGEPDARLSQQQVEALNGRAATQKY